MYSSHLLSFCCQVMLQVNTICRSDLFQILLANHAHPNRSMSNWGIYLHANSHTRSLVLFILTYRFLTLPWLLRNKFLLVPRLLHFWFVSLLPGFSSVCSCSSESRARTVELGTNSRRAIIASRDIYDNLAVRCIIEDEVKIDDVKMNNTY
jgi:hypothetical protein